MQKCEKELLQTQAQETQRQGRDGIKGGLIERCMCCANECDICLRDVLNLGVRDYGRYPIVLFGNVELEKHVPVGICTLEIGDKTHFTSKHGAEGQTGEYAASPASDQQGNFNIRNFTIHYYPVKDLVLSLIHI